MPKNNNLQDYLKDLYEGIKSRKPDASKNPQNFRQEIENLARTDDADAIAADIRVNKTAYVDNEKITGTIEDYNYSLVSPYGSTYIAPDGTKPFILYDELTTTWENRQTRLVDDSYPYSIDYKAEHLKGDTGRKSDGNGGESIVGEKHLFRVYFEVPGTYEGTTVKLQLVASGSHSVMGAQYIHYLYSIDEPLALNTNQNNMKTLWTYGNTDYSMRPLEERTVIASLIFNGPGVHYVDILVNFYAFGTNDTGRMDIKFIAAEE